MNVFGPRVCNARTVYSIFGQVFDEQGNLRSNRYTIDLTHLLETDTAGAVALATLIYWLRRQSIPVDVHYPESVDEALDYVSRRLAAGDSSAASKQTTHLPLTVLDPERAVDWVPDSLLPWMSIDLLISSTIASSRSRMLRELFVNAADHSYCRHIVAAAHCDREQQEVVCVVADDGIGIPQAVRRVWNESITDTVAIARAIEAGFSSAEREACEGKGLSRLVEKVVHRGQGEVVFYSGYGIVQCRTGVGNFVTSLGTADAFFPGTMIVASFPGESLGRIPFLNEPVAESDFYREG